MERDLEYENNNIAYDWQYTEEDGGGIKCKNYELCDGVLPKWWFECKSNYLCINCDMLFGILEISNNLECPICMENKRSIKLPNCEHTLCIECFKRCKYGDDDIENEPKFPYPDIEDEYYEHSENPKWDTEYPLIKIYNEEWNKWDDKREDKRETEKYLHKCPLCRK